MNARGGGHPRRALPADQRGLLPGRLRLTFADASFALGDIGQSKVYELIQTGDLLAVGTGRGRRITADSVRAYHENEVADVRRERGLPPEARCETCGRPRPGLPSAAGRDPRDPT